METTHLSLLQRAKDEMGSATWKEFFDLYSHLIDSWLRRRGLQAQDVEDVRQEVLTVVIRELPNFEHNGRTGAFRAWLRLATANRLRQFWRDSTRRKDRPDAGQFAELANQLEDPDSELSKMWDIEHDKIVLSKLLDRIEPDFKPRTVEAFRRIAIAREDEKRVAKDLEMTVNAVRIAQSRVLRTLRQLATGLID